MVLLYVIIVLFIVYALLIIYFWRSWVSIPEFEISEKIPVEKISVIIAARNEEDNIGILLQCLKRQSYPAALTEIIVVDDHSADQTAAIVESFAHVRLIRLTGLELNSYKKKAIETGIESATGSLIVTTDADCRPKDDWLMQLASFKTQRQSVFVAAPVVIHCGPSILEIFQALDFMVLQGITGASVHKNILNMCNGANLAYQRSAFVEVNGFSGADHIASGDDMLLMQKIADRYPGRLHYLKSNEAIVITDPAGSWREFFNQRIRWASKAMHYKSQRIFLILLLVYLVNLAFPALFIAGFWQHQLWTWVIILWLFKTLVEYPFFISLAKFFDKRWAIPWFAFFQPLHIIYTLISGLFGQFGKYEWKGRRVK